LIAVGHPMSYAALKPTTFRAKALEGAGLSRAIARLT
jgi:hypothetical protein